MRSRWVLLLAVTLLPGAAHAQDSSQPDVEDAPEAVEGVATEESPELPPSNLLAIVVAYGRGDEINSSVDDDVNSLWLRWSHRTRNRVLAGEPGFGFELVPYVRVAQEPVATGAGFHFLYEHRWVPDNTVRPLLRLGAGMQFTDVAVPSGETRYNFSIFAGAGVEAQIFASTHLVFEYRLHHISNADTGNVNPGINAHTFGVGLAWTF